MLFVAIDDLYYPQLGWWSFVDSCLRGRLKPLTCCHFGGSAAEKPSQEVAAAFRRLRTKTEEQEIWNHTWIYLDWRLLGHGYIYIIHMFLFDIFKHGKILQQISGGLQRLGPARSQRQLADTCCLPRLSIAFRTEMSMPLQAECWQLGCVDTCGITGICGRTSAISEYSYLFGSIYWE